MTREEQLDKFAEVVEEQKAAAKAASVADHPEHSPPADLDGDQSALVREGNQDVGSPREKNSGHGQVTADKWNQ